MNTRIVYATPKELTQERLKELLHYDPATGIFTRRTDSWAGIRRDIRIAKAGDIAGSVAAPGYRRILVDLFDHPAHRLAWLYVHGKWPADQIDHINHQRDDNRICNLREVTQQENARNLSLGKNNQSGHTGVYWRKDRQKWHASLRVNGNSLHLGYFASFDDAVATRKAAEKEHGYHANHGGEK